MQLVYNVIYLIKLDTHYTRYRSNIGYIGQQRMNKYYIMYLKIKIFAKFINHN